LKAYEELLADHQVECLVYFALADTQWKYGCLDERVKSKALELIAAGGDLKNWRQDSPKHPEFLFYIHDRRKNPVRILMRTGLVVSNKTPIKTDRFQWINIEFLPAQIQKALETFQS
jgi:hypothetical protein